MRNVKWDERLALLRDGFSNFKVSNAAYSREVPDIVYTYNGLKSKKHAISVKLHCLLKLTFFVSNGVALKGGRSQRIRDQGVKNFFFQKKLIFDL